MADEISGMEKVRLVLLAAGIAVAGSTGVQLASPDVRSEAFTLSMGKDMEERMLREQEIVHLQMLQNIPPVEVTSALNNLNRRLSKLENEMRRYNPDFVPEAYWE